MAIWAEQLDAQIAAAVKDWNLYTTLLVLLIAAFVFYPIIYPEEPDTHPLLLARQSTAAPVRKRNESSVYRSPEIPHGYPLKTGLNVKDNAAPRWASGRDGDLRDVWREVMRGGGAGSDGKPIPKGLIMTVLGKQEVVEHDTEALSKEINILGKTLRESGAKKVAIYLPNSMEYLLAIFACSFYGLTPILLPYNQPHPKVFELINLVEADALICAAGNLPLDDLAKQCSGLNLLTWVVEKTSRHMDWNGAPGAAEGRLKVGVWHDLVEDQQSDASASLPENEGTDKPADLITIWQSADPASKPSIVSFTHANLVAAIGALLTSLPLRQRLTSADLVLPADSFTHTYVLCWTFAALFAHCSVAINSVAGAGVDLQLASRAVSPTVVIAGAETMAVMHNKETAGITSGVQKFGMFTQSQAMSAGRMPTDTLLFKLLAPSSSAAGNKPGTLRLILTSDRLGAGSPTLTSTMLSDLRIFTRSRIVYALTASKVAGAVAQTNPFDYRREDGMGHSHFGAPVSSVEVKVVSSDDNKVGALEPTGELAVVGPAVVGGEVRLGIQGKVREDGTIAYV